MMRPAALLVLGTLVQVDAVCLTGSGAVAGNACTALSTCTDEAPNNKGFCKTEIIENYYCDEFNATFGTSCNTCTCATTCNGDGGDGSPLNWRPGASNPYGASGTSANGLVALTQAQQDDLVKQHNFLRAYHGACPLQWDALIAQNVANVAPSGWATCEAVNSPTTRAASAPGNWNSLGENVVVQSSVYYANNFPVRQKTMEWYLQSSNYDFAAGATNAQVTSSTAAFTQLVWKDTTHIGCQMYQCDYTAGKRVLLVCQYGTAGNIAGQFTAKVGTAGSAASACTTCGNLPSLAPTTSGPTKAPTGSPIPAPTSAPSAPGATSPPSNFPSKGPSASPKMPTGSPSKPPSGAPHTSTPSLNPSSTDDTSPPSAGPQTSLPSTSPINPSMSPSTSAPTGGPLQPTLSPSNTNDTSPPSRGPLTSGPTNAPVTSTPSLSPSALGDTSFPSNSPTLKPATVAQVQALLASAVAASTEVLSGSGSPHTVVAYTAADDTTNGKLVVTVTLSGSILQFDVTAQNNARNLIAAELGIDVSRVTVIAVQAGSVVLSMTIDNGVVIVTPVVSPPSGVETLAIVVPCIIGAVILITTIVLLVCVGHPACGGAAQAEEGGDGTREIEDPEKGEGEGEGDDEPVVPYGATPDPKPAEPIEAEMDEEEPKDY